MHDEPPARALKPDIPVVEPTIQIPAPLVLSDKGHQGVGHGMGRGDYHILWCGGGASRPGGQPAHPGHIQAKPPRPGLAGLGLPTGPSGPGCPSGPLLPLAFGHLLGDRLATQPGDLLALPGCQGPSAALAPLACLPLEPRANGRMEPTSPLSHRHPSPGARQVASRLASGAHPMTTTPPASFHTARSPTLTTSISLRPISIRDR